MMLPIGFSTGALARGDVQHGVQMLRGTTANAVELSALRQNELPVLVDLLDQLDLHQFEYVSVHAPSAIEAEYEDTALELLARVQGRGWPIIVHPDAMHHVSEWSRFRELLYVENMDIRKPIGQTASDLVFYQFLIIGVSLNSSKARLVDPP